VDRVIRCIGKRRIVVTTDGKNTVLNLWLGDPPHGKQLGAPTLEPLERDKLLLALTEIKVHE
jgi:hypothetical protein